MAAACGPPAAVAVARRAAIAPGPKTVCGLLTPLGTNRPACGGRWRPATCAWMLAASLEASSEPSTDVPIVPPICRQNWIWLVATPRNWRGQAILTARQNNGEAD